MHKTGDNLQSTAPLHHSPTQLQQPLHLHIEPQNFNTMVVPPVHTPPATEPAGPNMNTELPLEMQPLAEALLLKYHHILVDRAFEMMGELPDVVNPPNTERWVAKDFHKAFTNFFDLCTYKIDRGERGPLVHGEERWVRWRREAAIAKAVCEEPGLGSMMRTCRIMVLRELLTNEGIV
ncbi:hypothetical protein EDC01DRAFT_440504 [Geopyxis carbonaria]|nr:hypothetical protein EDC01DRAFT_440504 [Geopyxis carbonaria]